MLSDELKNIVDKISEQGKMSFFDGVTEELITRFEEENNVKLPTQYREWLSVFCPPVYSFMVLNISRQ